jgi:hypothetical protein
MLKRLSNRFTWGGSVVHSVIRQALHSIRKGADPDGSALTANARSLMRKDFAASKRHAYRTENIRKEFHGLVEHEYDEALGDEVWKKNWQNVEAALGWFFSSRWPTLARTLDDSAWLEIDEMDFDKSHFGLEGVKVFAAPDLAYVDTDGTTHIVDWKTGRSRDSYDDQVVLYALYLQKRYGLPIERMTADLVYLNESCEKSVAVEQAAIADVLRRFAASVHEMRSLLNDAVRNEPRPEEAFEKTDTPAKCGTCPFRRPCGRA